MHERNNLTMFTANASKLLINVQHQRHHRVERTCSGDVRGNVECLVQYQDISYCISHKIASTFWMRMFRFPYNDTKTGHVKSPFDISKFDTHLLKYKHIKEFPLNAKSEKAIFRTFRFMFVREPFAKLWSVYIDKYLFVGDYFWRIYGKKIKDLRPKAQSRALCYPVSFLEFLKFIVKSGTENAANLDDHCRPVHYGCNPCKFKPDFIGKVETIVDDSRYILTRLGQSWVADVHSHEERIREETSMLIDFNYELVTRKSYLLECVSFAKVAEKLWQAFQINGYIPTSAKITLSDGDLKDKNRFKTFVWDTLKQDNRPRTSDMIKTQRQSMKLQAYKEIPREVLKGIQRIFQKDFELFGYDPEPVDIFNQTAV